MYNMQGAEQGLHILQEWQDYLHLLQWRGADTAVGLADYALPAFAVAVAPLALAAVLRARQF